MIRTLTLVCLLTLLAGLALGMFVAHAALVLPEPKIETPPPADLDRIVELSRLGYGLDDREAAEVRKAYEEYQQGFAAELKRLRKAHPEKFTELRATANAKIKKVADAARDRAKVNPTR